MVKLYTTPSCLSCRKAKKWLKENDIPHQEINIFVKPITEDIIYEILEKTENGVEDIISLRSKVVKESGIDLEDKTLSELIDFIKENPSVLKRPIIIDEFSLQIGYNEDEIRTFIPRERRRHY